MSGPASRLISVVSHKRLRVVGASEKYREMVGKHRQAAYSFGAFSMSDITDQIYTDIRYHEATPNILIT